jgi:uncharacterized protein (DUF2236 family)
MAKPKRIGSDAGLFSQESVIRRIDREALSLLGGGRAILLQLAHPLVAAAVADYSGFQADPLARLFRTLDLMHTLVSGNRQQAHAAAQRFCSMHEGMQGQLPQDAGCFPAGTSYSAADPHLKLWVYATLVDTSLFTYQRFVTPLSPDECNSYYADTLVLARLLGIPDGILPPTLEAFHSYMDTMLAGDRLAVANTARRLAWRVLDPDVGFAQYACAGLLRFVTAGLLPKRFRAAYRLRWSLGRQKLLDNFSRTTRILRPVVPAWLWRSPQNDGVSLLRSLLWPKR